MNSILKTVALIAVLGSTLPMTAHAQFGGLFGGGSSEPSGPSVEGLVDNNNNIVQRYQSALGNLLTAQDILKEALGISEQGERAAGTAESLGGGVVEKDELERATALTEENNQLITKKIAEGGKLDEASRVQYATALPYYAKGTLDSYLIIPEATAFAANVSSKVGELSSNPMAVLDLLELRNGVASGLFVASELPSLIGEWYNNSAALITFGQENDVDVSEAETAMGQIEL